MKANWRSLTRGQRISIAGLVLTALGLVLKIVLAIPIHTTPQLPPPKQPPEIITVEGLIGLNKWAGSASAYVYPNNRLGLVSGDQVEIHKSGAENNLSITLTVVVVPLSKNSTIGDIFITPCNAKELGLIGNKSMENIGIFPAIIIILKNDGKKAPY